MGPILGVVPATSSSGRGTSSASNPRRWKTRLPRPSPGTAWPSQAIRVMRTARRKWRLPDAVETLAGRLRWQATGCEVLGSPFYARLLESATADLEAGGPVWQVLSGFEKEDRGSAIALRLLAPVHRKVLAGDLTELDRHYPSTGGDGDAMAAWPRLREFLQGNVRWMRNELRRPC